MVCFFFLFCPGTSSSEMFVLFIILFLLLFPQYFYQLLDVLRIFFLNVITEINFITDNVDY